MHEHTLLRFKVKFCEVKGSEQTLKGDGNVKLYPRIYHQTSHTSRINKEALVLLCTILVRVLLESVSGFGHFCSKKINFFWNRVTEELGC